MDSVAVLKLNIMKTIEEILKLINDKVKNKDDDYVVEFKEKLIGIQNILEDK